MKKLCRLPFAIHCETVRTLQYALVNLSGAIIDQREPHRPASRRDRGILIAIPTDQLPCPCWSGLGIVQQLDKFNLFILRSSPVPSYLQTAILLLYLALPGFAWSPSLRLNKRLCERRSLRPAWRHACYLYSFPRPPTIALRTTYPSLE